MTVFSVSARDSVLALSIWRAGFHASKCLPLTLRGPGAWGADPRGRRRLERPGLPAWWVGSCPPPGARFPGKAEEALSGPEFRKTFLFFSSATFPPFKFSIPSGMYFSVWYEEKV